LNALLLMVGIGATSSIYLSVQSDAANINMAGRQRMLSQRLAKEVLMVAQGVGRRTAVEETIALFERSHNKLLVGDPTIGITAATNPEVRSQLESVEQLWKGYIKELIGYLDNRDQAHLLAIKEQSVVVLKEMNQAVKMMEALAEKRVISQAWNAVIMIAVILFFCLIIFIFVNNKLVNPLRELIVAFNRGAKGDISGNLPDDGGAGEMSEAFRAYNVMIESFSAMVSTVAQSASAVGVMSDKQSVLVESTVQGVQAQHFELDQVATAMTEMAASVLEVASHAEQTASAALAANTEATDCSHIMADTISSMDGLRDRVESAAQVITRLEGESQEISKVLDVIRSISEQTNLLALNAAIEAARAGEHGRGFAVVADEVRALASKTKGATDEINDMIQRLQTQVRKAVAEMKISQDDAGNSASQATEAGTALDKIVIGINEITQMMSEIATSTLQQSTASDELGRNVTNISSSSESTSIMASQTLDATRCINSKMSELRTQASCFKTNKKYDQPKTGEEIADTVNDDVLF